MEKRKNKRVPVDLYMIITSLAYNDEPDHKVVDTPIHVKDISKEGLGFECAEELGENEYFKADIDVNGIKTIKAVLQILRKVPGENGFSYGCRIIGYASIYDFVYDALEKEV